MQRPKDPQTKYDEQIETHRNNRDIKKPSTMTPEIRNKKIDKVRDSILRLYLEEILTAREYRIMDDIIKVQKLI